MSQFVQFIGQHWGLALLFIGSFFWVVMIEAQGKAGKGLFLTPQELTMKVNRDNAVVIDIRNSNSFAAGHIVDSKNIAADTIKQDPEAFLKKYKKKTTIIVCEQGQTAKGILQQVRKLGADQSFLLHGGLNAWRQAELPLVKG